MHVHIICIILCGKLKEAAMRTNPM